MKKFLLIFLSFLISIGIAGCTVTPPNGGDKPPVVEPPIVDPNPPPVDPGDNDDTPFTVSLWEVSRNAPFPIFSSDGTTALWTSKDDGSVIEVPFNTDGVAEAEGLDGDYAITIDSLPEGYAYNPNAFTATNDERSVVIPIYEISKASGAGTGWYENSLNLTKTGAVYRLTLNSASQKIYCTYAPPVTGEYYIESWADITANEINPRIDVHNANKGWIETDRVMESVNSTEDAACSVFTKNFKYKISAYATTFLCAFELMCDSRVGYPVVVDLCVARDSDYDFGEETEYELYMPKEEFKQTPTYDGQTFGYIANDDPDGVLRGERVGFNSDDGYYHMLDENGAMTETILYAKIKGAIISPSGIQVIDFQTMSSEGTGPDGTPSRGLNLYLGKYNYTFMIQGYEGLVNINYPGASYYKNSKSYVDYVNGDGVYAVTQELKDFLQAYSKRESYFYDGYGFLEGIGYNSNDTNQWLFACGYYK